MQVRDGVRPVRTDMRVGEQIGLPEYARWNHVAPSARFIASRFGVAAGDPVRDQSPHPMSSASIMTKEGGDFAAVAAGA